MDSAARIVGPLLAGLLYFGLGHAAPYRFGAIVIVTVIFLGQPLLRSRVSWRPLRLESPSPYNRHKCRVQQ